MIAVEDGPPPVWAVGALEVVALTNPSAHANKQSSDQRDEWISSWMLQPSGQNRQRRIFGDFRRNFQSSKYCNIQDLQHIFLAKPAS
jgi:hypothetical protein